MYNFDKVVDRRNTDNVKYDYRKEYFGNAEVLPMWVADMDFETPEFIREAILKRAEHPIYGYSVRGEGYFNSIINWQKRRLNWEIEKDWIMFSPGVVPAFNFAVHAFTKPGDKILVQPPVYFPFFSAINNNHRVQVENQLVLKDGRYQIDFDDLRRKARDAKMLFLCSPHNPVGRCWKKEELLEIANICLENEVILLSDEIHGDLILPGFKHIPTASLSKEIADITVTCIAPSKTFNIAGLDTSSVIISNQNLREKYQDFLKRIHINSGNLFGAIACEAGYTHGDQWLEELMQYIQKNYLKLKGALDKFETLELMPLEATYLAWIDFRKTKMTDEFIKETLIHKANLGFSSGPVFGAGGEGFQRINLAAPSSLIDQAILKLNEHFE
jgi:cystathionine beta-lyase